MRAWLDALVTVLLAPVCAACRAPLCHPSRGCVCEACWQGVERFRPPLCAWCGDPFSDPENTAEPAAGLLAHATVCPQQRRQTAIDRARAAGPHTGSLRAVIHAFKYGGRRSVAVGLAALMRDAGTDVLDGAEVVVPVPLHRARLRSRGFNQADDLAAHLELPVVHALRRIRHTDVQANLTAQDRLRNVAGAFAAARSSGDVRGATVVLVDDVRTTGATLEACALALKQSGAREVRVLTAARVALSPP